ncbi:hypothetical protein M422DRAFT_24623 [Sphaerobolus stellatus SS14]|nr:hypothetical protein M422DRAFT_24623 [Sphaerobolus stellatus SS14]
MSVSKAISPQNQQGDKSKRKRGQLSCAECRRLKLSCDRVFPCESCTKRGCAAICPDGSLATKGTRFVLANTEAYHTKISVMSERIRELETALDTMNPDVPHPLLRQDLLMVKVPLELNQNVDLASFPGESQSPVVPKQSPSAEAVNISNPVLPPLLNPSGTLKLSGVGRSEFYGQTAYPEKFLKDFDKDVFEEPDYGADIDPLPIQIQNMAGVLFVVGSRERNVEIAQQLLDSLPPPHDLDYLVDTYYSNSAWMYEPCSRELFTPSLTHVLEYVHRPAEVDLHRLSLVYAVLSHGSLMDLKQEPYNAQSYTYHRLSRACLAATNFIEKPSIFSVQILFLLGYYWILSNKKDGGNRGWLMQCLAIKLAETMGLHKDLDQWDRKDRMQSEARRRAMWELLTLEGWMSLGLGRPTTIKLSELQCKMPEASGRALRKQGTHVWHTWKHGFALYISRVLEKTSSVQTPPYLDILDLDRAMQGYKLPEDSMMLLNGMTPPPPPPEKVPSLDMQRALVIQAQSTALVLLHRGFFGKALEEQTDPLQSRFSPSVFATYSHAWRVVFALQTVYSKHPELTKRFGLFWSNAFSASISLCLLVTHATHSNYASAAMHGLNVLFDVFTSASPSCIPAAKALPTVTRLRDKAQSAYTPHVNGNPRSGFPGRTRQDSDDDDDVELKALGGKTNIAQLPVPSSSSRNSRFLSRNPPASVPMSPMPLPVTDDLQGVHPLLLEYVTQSKFVSSTYEQPEQQQGYHPRTKVEEMPTSLAYDSSMYSNYSQGHYDSSQPYSTSSTWNHSQSPEQPWASPPSGYVYSDSATQAYDQYNYQQQPHYSANPSLQPYSETADENQYAAWKTHMEQLGLPF